MTGSLNPVEAGSGVAMGRKTAVVRRHRPRRVTVLLPVVGLIALAVCGLLVFGIVTARVGLLGMLIGVAAALIPVAIAVATLLWVDRWEPEPAKLLLTAFGWGACVAAVIALVLNDTAAAVGEVLIGKGYGDTFGAIVSAPLVEEAAKGVFVLLLLWRRRREFDGIVDGMVYAGIVAAGFAFTENIYYFGTAYAEYGFGTGTSPGVLATFILRGVLSPFTHPLFAVFTGIGIGYAARTPIRVLRVIAPLGGYLLAVVLHALWNAAATLGDSSAFVNLYFLVMVPIFAGVVLLVLWQRRREQRIVAAALPSLAEAKWIAPSEVELLGSLAERKAWRRQARRESGRRAAQAVGEYQAVVSELAFLRRNVVRGTAGPDPGRRQRELLTALTAARAEAVRLADGSPSRRPAHSAG